MPVLPPSSISISMTTSVPAVTRTTILTWEPSPALTTTRPISTPSARNTSVKVPLGMPESWKVPFAFTSTVSEEPSTRTVTLRACDDAEPCVSAALAEALVAQHHALDGDPPA